MRGGVGITGFPTCMYDKLDQLPIKSPKQLLCPPHLDTVKDAWDSPDEKKIKADTKLTVAKCSQIFDRKTTAPSCGDLRRLADLDLDSWSLRKSLTFKTFDCK